MKNSFGISTHMYDSHHVSEDHDKAKGKGTEHMYIYVCIYMRQQEKEGPEEYRI